MGSAKTSPIVDPQPDPPRPSTVTMNDIATELKRIARKGLPVDRDRAGEHLPNLRSVVARSIHPDDPVSRLDALNQLLVRLLADIGDDARGEALRILFGVAKGSARMNLMERRAAAAALLGYDPDHFRKRVEPKLIAELAVATHRDLLRYKARLKRAVEALEPTGDTPRLDETHFTHEEELISRIWQHVYALRAELIAIGRRELAADAGARVLEIEEHRQAAAAEEREVQTLITEFVKTYGKALIRHGEVEYAAEGLARLVAWTLGTTSTR